AQGGQVGVNGDGSFTYTPPSGYIGIDTFTYTIQDSAGLTDTATVTINVLNPGNPVAANDSYQTIRNLNLSIAAPGLLANDTTSVGTLSTVAETKPTAQGGSVTINTNGSFSYTPPSNYTGTDSFTYTASNGGGTSIATVSIQVLTPVFLRLEKVNDTLVPVVNQCNGGPAFGGSYNRATFRLSFFSDAGGSTPLDVTGLGLVVNMRRTTVIGEPGNPSTSFDFDVSGLNGTTYDVYTDINYYNDTVDCFGNRTFFSQDYSLLAGNYTII
ncbi:MAG TPA: Ig-like domain-containing protein, partial [Flavisolibacter sp.]|nr:Ig-like domain-containing protein [Flavisolibacter sp.]